MKRFSALMLVGLMAVALVRVEAQAVPALDAIKSDAELTRAISALDTQLFDAYNNCDIDKLGSLVTDDLEFYHDKTGLAVGKQPFLVAIKNNICGKVRRELVKGSLEVYPLKGYGAVEIGTHRFYHPGTQDHDVVGEAKFVQLWQYKDGAWKVSRVISYDHETVK
jgi:ketosteroid isomerase-like protein